MRTEIKIPVCIVVRNWDSAQRTVDFRTQGNLVNIKSRGLKQNITKVIYKE